MIKKENRICLAMIIKNHADVIEKSLESLREFVDYYVICDLNSSDGSVKVIENFFKKYKIKGEIYKLKEDEISNNAGKNRTLCMKLARGKGDYLLLMNPNEKLVCNYNSDIKTGDVELSKLELPKLELDIYRVLIKQNITNYQNYDYRILKGDHLWEFKGAACEYIINDVIQDNKNIGNMGSVIFIEEIINKKEIIDYKRDALLLEKEILDEPENINYAFALAESYKRCYEYENAIKNYERILKIGSDNGKMFYAKYEIGLCKMLRGDRFENFVGDLLLAYNYKSDRLEPIYRIIRYCRMNDMVHLSWYLFKHILDDDKKLEIEDEEMAINIERDIYDYKLLDELAIAAQYVGKYAESIKIIEKILEGNKYNRKEEKRIKKNLETIKKKIGKNGNENENKSKDEKEEIKGEEIIKNEESKKGEMVKMENKDEQNPKKMEEIFDEIIRQNEWGYKNQKYEIATGYGNTEETTVEYRKLLSQVMESNKIRHVIDIGCGIWEFEHREFDDMIYIGVDCVNRVIEFNKKHYSKKNRFFIYADALDANNNIPEVDLCIIKDVLQHLSNRNIVKMLDKAIERVKYILIVQDHQSDGEILDIDDGEYRPLSIYREPLSRYRPKLIGKYWTKDISVIGKDLSKFKVIINKKKDIEKEENGGEEVGNNEEMENLLKLPKYEEDMERNIKMVVEKEDKEDKEDKEGKEDKDEKKLATKKGSDADRVLLAILARNKAHVLDRYLQCIENLEYNKGKMEIYINTNNNSDNTIEILDKWVEENREKYSGIEYEKHENEEMKEISSKPHDWSDKRFKVLGEIRNKSLRKAKEKNCEYYFVVDCDNFIVPETLKKLIAEDKPIIAPMLRAIPEMNDPYSNYFCAVSPNGYYKHHMNYEKILKREMVGTFEVPVVHCTYLIKTKYLDKLNYIDNTHHHEFVIFSRHARDNGVEQYICNKIRYGECVHFYNENIALEEEKLRVEEYYKRLRS